MHPESQTGPGEQNTFKDTLQGSRMRGDSKHEGGKPLALQLNSNMWTNGGAEEYKLPKVAGDQHYSPSLWNVQ